MAEDENSSLWCILPHQRQMWSAKSPTTSQFRNLESGPVPNLEFSRTSALTLYHLGPPMASWMICSSLRFGIWSSRFRVKGQRTWLDLLGGGAECGMGLLILGLLNAVNPSILRRSGLVARTESNLRHDAERLTQLIPNPLHVLE